MTRFFTKCIHTIAAGAMAAAAFLPADAATLYGVKNYCAEGCSSGVYTIDTTPGSQPELYWAVGDMIGNAGAVYDGKHLYSLGYLDLWGQLMWAYLICDVEAQTFDFEMPSLTPADAGDGLAYDPTEGVAYSVCLDLTEDAYNLSTMDMSNGRKSVVGRLPGRIFALACTPKGQLYGVGEDGWLYAVDKYTAGIMPVGDTGVIPTVDQCAVIDPATGVMYWASYTSEGGALRTIDTATGASELVTTFDPSFQFSGIFLLSEEGETHVPATASNISVSFEGASLSGTMSMTLPAQYADGTSIAADAAIDWTVTCEGVTLAQGTGLPGQVVDTPVTVPHDGDVRLNIATSLDGQASTTNFSFWAGYDTPCAVENCTLSADGYDLTLQWTMPERGIHGGYVDAGSVVYRIDRGPEDVFVADVKGTCLFTERVEREGIYPVMYRITPVVGEFAGEAVITDYLLVGECFRPDFALDLTDPYSSILFDIVDYNSDGCSWMYDFTAGALKCEWPLADTSDDWLISAPIYLEANRYHTLEVQLRSEGKWNYSEQHYDPVYAGTVTPYIGTEPDPASMTTELCPSHDVEQIDWHLLDGGTNEAPKFTVDTDGVYYIGLHHTGPRSIYYTFLRELKITAGESSLVMPGTDGTAPAVVLDGRTLTVENPAGYAVTVATTDGRVVLVSTDEYLSTDLQAGIYIVTAGDVVTKVAVR